MLLCGIDEAGRGCIIGPLVICGAVIDDSKLQVLKDLGVKDSKLISPRKRAFLAKELPKHVKFRIIEVPPSEIDDYVLSDGNDRNLNWLEADKTVELINMLDPDKAFIDCPSNNVKAYKGFLVERLLNKKVELVVEHGADAKYLIAGAASILAKVARDKEIENIKKIVNSDFGSGYMADPRTASFLRDHWEDFPSFFRHSWAPYQKLKMAKLQKGLDSFNL